MTFTTYDPEADAAYFKLGKAAIWESEEVHPNVIFDLDADGRLIGIEVLNASAALAPGAWFTAPLPDAGRPVAE